MSVVTVELAENAAAYNAVALIAPLGIDTDFQRFHAFEAPDGWHTSIVAEQRTGQRAAILVPRDRNATAHIRHAFADVPSKLPGDAYIPEGTALAMAALELAVDARRIAAEAGGGRAGIQAIVSDTSARFDYGEVPADQRWYYGQNEVPQVACTAGDCIDINTYLVAALRAAGYATAYLTCYYFDDNPAGIESGMHCWVRTCQDGVVEDWDIAHFKKVNRSDVAPALNPVPGKRFALAYGRDHLYRWGGLDIKMATPSRPMWVRENGDVVWGAPPKVTLQV